MDQRKEQENLKKLLKLKQYETPGEEYFDNFLVEFQSRRARESSSDGRQSFPGQPSWVQLKERVLDWYQDLGPEKWAVPAGSMAAAIIAFMALGGKDTVTRSEPAKMDVKAAGHPSAPQVLEIQIPTISENDAEDPDKATRNPSLLPVKAR